MSEPVTNAEVEDVLSSIRRLVSEGKRPQQTAGEVAPSGNETSAASGSAAEPAMPSDRTAGEAETGAADRSLRLDPQERPFTSTRRTASAEPAPSPEQAADRLVLTPALRVTASPEQPGTAEAEVEGEATLTVSPYDYDMLHDDPDDLEAGDIAAGDQAAENSQAEEDAEQLPTFVHARATAEVESGSSFTAPETRGGRLSDKIAALETAIGKIPEQWEPDGPGDGELSGTEPPAMAWEDDAETDEETSEFGPDALPQPSERARDRTAEAPHIEEQVRRFADSGPRTPEVARPSPASGPASEEPSAGFGTEDQFLDEEALRDLVTEIVRAELQGALGERITRNVRKLVRREIHRAMTAQDLE